jgi:TctA family transporter
LSPSESAAIVDPPGGPIATATAFDGSASTFVGAATACVGSAATASRVAGGVEPDEEY